MSPFIIIIVIIDKYNNLHIQDGNIPLLGEVLIEESNKAIYFTVTRLTQS